MVKREAFRFPLSAQSILSAPVELRLLQQTLHNRDSKRKLRKRCDLNWSIAQDSR